MCGEWLSRWCPECPELVLHRACNATEIIPRGKSSRQDEIIQKTLVKFGKPSGSLWMFWSSDISCPPPWTRRAARAGLQYHVLSDSKHRKCLKWEEETEKGSLCGQHLIWRRHVLIEVAVTLEMLHLDSVIPLLSREDANSAAETQQCCPARGASQEHRASLWFSLTAPKNSVSYIWKFNLTLCQTDLGAALPLVPPTLSAVEPQDVPRAGGGDRLTQHGLLRHFPPAKHCYPMPSKMHRYFMGLLEKITQLLPEAWELARALSSQSPQSNTRWGEQHTPHLHNVLPLVPGPVCPFLLPGEAVLRSSQCCCFPSEDTYLQEHYSCIFIHYAYRFMNKNTHISQTL